MDFNYTYITEIVDRDLPFVNYGGFSTHLLIPVFLLWNPVGIVIELAFLRGIYFLVGWRSNFSFTMLFFITCCALEINIVHLLGTLLTYFDWFDYYKKQYPAFVSFTIRFLGNSMIVPYMTIIFSNITLTVHRLGLTLRPVTVQHYLTEKTLKIVSASILVFHIFMQILLQNVPIHAFYFIPKILDTVGTESFDDDNLNQFWMFFNISTVVIILSYPCIFCLLYYSGKLNFKKNKEIRMTIQASVSVFFEFLMFLYLPFRQKRDSYDILIHPLVYVSYGFVILLPYMCLNRTVRDKIFIWKRPTPPRSLNLTVRVI